MATRPLVQINEEYEQLYGFKMPERYVFKAKQGLTHEVVKEISWMKSEPAWMTKFRLRSLDHFLAKPLPTWADLELLEKIQFDAIYYYLKPTEKKSDNWDDVPEDIKKTFDRLGIPEAERKFLAGVSAQYESESVYHSMHEDLTRQGVIFLDMDTALKEQPELVKEYFATVIPPADNKFSALNSAVWSGGSFIYVPKGVSVEMPLQAYFRINAERMGQFERTLIIADEGSSVHYIEGCTAPVYSSDSLHSAVVELIAKPHAKLRYTTIQN
ncbi:MAG: Fe-S cluster assembly protein SufB, partial [Candidatus Omnitrophica bacterium]|nr:Fe-S cluster assembly protein SufB [Candidatus Omnitrophota bacterium]